jgi:hypothetical protein
MLHHFGHSFGTQNFEDGATLLLSCVCIGLQR